MTRKAAVGALALAIAVVTWQALPAAWGNRGHLAVAELAQARLSGTAATAVATILGGARLADVALWADEVRKTTHKHTYNWHFVNIPITSQGYLASRDCQPSDAGDCVVAALGRLEATLKNPKASAKQRREALKFVVHFVGDIHQPLHCGHNADVGGTQRAITQIGDSTSLHSAWDTGIIQASNKTVAKLVADANVWLATQNEATLESGTYRQWAMESFRISRDVAYVQVAADNAISSQERTTSLGIVERQIAKGGVRLAAVLDRTLGGS